MAACLNFCPAAEARERAARAGGLHICERGPGAHAVKAYRRTAEAVADELRPLPVLAAAQQYLFSQVAARNDIDVYSRVNFIADRLRAIRQDVVMQQLASARDTDDGVSASLLLKRQVCFHVTVGYGLCGLREVERGAVPPDAKQDSGFDPVMNDDRLVDAVLLLQDAARSHDTAKPARAARCFAACIRLSMALLDASDVSEIIADHANLRSDDAGLSCVVSRAAFQLWAVTRASAVHFVTGRWRAFLQSLSSLADLAGPPQWLISGAGSVPADAGSALSADAAASTLAELPPPPLSCCDAFVVRLLLQRYVPIARVQLLRQMSVAMRRSALPAPDVARLLCLQRSCGSRMSGSSAGSRSSEANSFARFFAPLPTGDPRPTCPQEAAFDAARLGVRLGLEVTWSVDAASPFAALLPIVGGPSAPVVPADGSAIAIPLDAVKLAELRCRSASASESHPTGSVTADKTIAAPSGEGGTAALELSESAIPDVRIAVDKSRDLDPRLARSDPAMAAAVRPQREDELVGWPAGVDLSVLIAALCSARPDAA